MTILTLRPNSDSGTQQWVCSAGSSHYALVDEDPASDSDYVYTVYNNKIDRYGFPGHTTETGVISSVKVYARAKQIDGAFRDGIYIGLQVSSSDYLSSMIQPTNSYTVYSNTWNTNPATSSAWAWSDIDSLISVIKSFGTSYNGVYVSQLYLEVNYTPSVASSWGGSWGG